MPRKKSKPNSFAKRGVACLRIVGEIVGVPTESLEKELPVNGTIGDYCSILAKSVEDLMKSNIPQAMRTSLENLRDQLARMATEDDSIKNARWRITNYLQIFLLENIVAGCISSDRFEGMEKNLSDILSKVMVPALRQSVTILPCANAAYNDYTETQKRVSCFKGTRQALLQEVIAWLADPDSNIYVLFGLAGIGKSTIAQTVAEMADGIHLLGASFFFSRDEQDRRTAKMLFTTIASQLCVYDPDFAKAIESVLSTEKGKSAIRKLPIEQLETLILEPLRKLTPRKVVIVVDALDECDDEDAPAVLMGLNKLVQSLPSFRIVLTTRPQPHLQFLLNGRTSQRIFHLHNIEEKVVDSDIELYLRYNLAWEQVRIRLPALTKPWAASDEDIQSLVRASGRLFIIASTAVLFILDKTSTPKFRMAKLRMALDHNRTPFKTLNDFYTTILRSAVPEDCERDTANLYQTVIGSIILVQQPLSIYSLATLTNIEVDNITAVLGNLQSVILLGSNDIPVVYHKSFPDYIQDPARCKDEDLRIDAKFHHTRMATRCLLSLNERLKMNIMDLCGDALFMDNDEALKTQGLSDTEIQEKIPMELQYACLYFADHIESANAEDTELMKELLQLLNERFTNWIEALSWIGKLDSGHRTLLTIQRQLKQTSSVLRQFVADGLRFVWKFYDLIRQSALHTYHSALPFTPIETSLYRKYRKQMSLCRVQGGQKTWDGLIATRNSGSSKIMHIIFSPNSTLFACCSNKQEQRDGFFAIAKEENGDFVTTDEEQSDGFIKKDEEQSDGFVTIHDAVAGIPLGRIEGKVFAIASGFSKVAAFNDGSITIYHIQGVTPVNTIIPSATVVKLAISPDGSRLVAALADGTVSLWDTERAENLGKWEKGTRVYFSSDGSRAAFASSDGIIKLLDETNGKVVAELAFPGRKEPIVMFSGDGSRLACLDWTLKVWNSRDGALIGKADEAGKMMAISSDGSLIATCFLMLKLWSGHNLALLKIVNLDITFPIVSLAIRKDWIGIASPCNVALYDSNSHSFVAQMRLPLFYTTAFAFSPDCTRLAAGSIMDGDVWLWDVPSITASNAMSQKQSSEPTRLGFSPDNSRLASGHEDGTVKLWDTSNMAQLATHKRHSTRITALAYSVDGGLFASGSADGVIRLWNGEGGEPCGSLACSDEPDAMVLSSSVMATATKAGITVWDLKTHSHIARLGQNDTTYHSHLLALSHRYSLLASCMLAVEHNSAGSPLKYILMLWDIIQHRQHMPIITFGMETMPQRMRFLPDDLQLAIQLANGSFRLLNLHDNGQSEVSENEGVSRLGLLPSWHGIPVWFNGVWVVGRSPRQEEAVKLLKCPSERFKSMAEGSSMFALGYEDGRILLIKPV